MGISRFRAVLILLGALTLSLSPFTRAATLVSPNALAGTEGNTDNGFPFNIANFALSSQRYQQVYASSDFAAFCGPQLITQIAFRPDAVNGAAFSSTLSNIQIDFSTTSAAVDGLSPTFASNVGADDTIVHSGALSLSSAFTGPAGGPKDFDIVITLTTPFLYDPGAGNLLLDVRNFAGGFTTQFDAENTSGDPISRSYTVSGGVANPTATTVDSFGLITQFTFGPVAVPLPASVWGGLVLLGLMGLAALRRKAARA